MRVMKWSVIALAVAAGTSQMAVASDQSESKGFVEDSTLSLLARSMYYNRDARNGASRKIDSNGNRVGYSEEWGASARALFESGFTQGTVGFGVNAYAGALWQLDTGSGRRGLGMFPDDNGSEGKDLTIANAAVKARISNTVLTYGSQMPALPVLAYDDGRLLPETFEGTMITSKEIEGLELNVGRFTAQNAMNQSGRDSFRDDDGVGILKSINVAGGSYAFTKDFSAALYYSDLEDRYKRKYANLNYNLPLTEEQALGFDFNIYKSDYDRQFGGGDNTIWSLAAKYSVGAHAFILAHQRNTGDRGFDYGVGDGGGAIFVANSFLSDFNLEDERSWQASYELDFATYGVPGLSFKTAYIWADDITTRDAAGAITADDGKEHELFNQVKYTVQSGAAKDLSFRLRSSVLRSNSEVGTDTNEVRFYVNYPLSVL